MMKKIKHIPVAAFCLAVIMSAPMRAGTVIVYQQTFDNTTEAPIDPADVRTDYGWTHHVTASGSLATGAWGITSDLGDPNAGTDRGYIFSNTQFAQDPESRSIFWTEQIAANPVDIADIVSVTWMQGNQNAPAGFGDQLRVALRVNDSWYVSALADPQTQHVWGDGEFASNAQLITFSFAGAGWETLNFNGSFSGNGTVMERGSSATLPGTGSVQAVGLFFDEVNETRRFDTFTVVAIPEPSTFLLFGLAGAGAILGAGRRKRRR